MADKKLGGARITVRLSDQEHTALRTIAEARNEDLATLIREAIAAYVQTEEHVRSLRTEHERLALTVAATMKREADRVISRHDDVTRALIAALNDHLGRKS